jgi:hypothetical protein
MKLKKNIQFFKRQSTKKDPRQPKLTHQTQDRKESSCQYDSNNIKKKAPPKVGGCHTRHLSVSSSLTRRHCVIHAPITLSRFCSNQSLNWQVSNSATKPSTILSQLKSNLVLPNQASTKCQIVFLIQQESHAKSTEVNHHVWSKINSIKKNSS